MTERECRRLVPIRSGGLCERCGVGGGLTLHHRKKRGQGGEWSPVNIVHLCGHGTVGCHGWVEHNPNAAAEEGFHVRSWEDPAEIPCRTWRGVSRLTVEVEPYNLEEITQDHWSTNQSRMK